MRSKLCAILLTRALCKQLFALGVPIWMELQCLSEACCDCMALERQCVSACAVLMYLQQNDVTSCQISRPHRDTFNDANPKHVAVPLLSSISYQDLVGISPNSSQQHGPIPDWFNPLHAMFGSFVSCLADVSCVQEPHHAVDSLWDTAQLREKRE